MHVDFDSAFAVFNLSECSMFNCIVSFVGTKGVQGDRGHRGERGLQGEKGDRGGPGKITISYHYFRERSFFVTHEVKLTLF